jgi:lipopolysaccharide cholinephosphotransferase
MNQTDENLGQVQKFEFEMLVEFKRICTLLNLKYFLLGGTLIGAIRHSGFIPWDDDVDVCMPREDYDQFLKIAPNKICPKFRIEDVFAMPDNDFSYCKIKYKGKKISCCDNQKMRVNHELWIDIFPIDKICNDEKKRARAIKAFRRRSFVLCCKCGDVSHSLFKHIIKKIIAICYPVSKNKLKLLLANQFEQFKYEKNPKFNTLCGTFLNSKYFEAYTMKAFEGQQFMVPAMYDQMLRDTFGDYMQLPPVKDRVSHNVVLIEDSN